MSTCGPCCILNHGCRASIIQLLRFECYRPKLSAIASGLDVFKKAYLIEYSQMFLKIIYHVFQLIGIFVAMFLSTAVGHGSDAGLLVVNPEEYVGALRNPLKGFRPDMGRNVSRSRFATLARHYIKWNDLEQRKTDDLVANIRAYSDRKWAKLRGTGVKVIPRVYLDWDRESGNEYWPNDLESGDYSSPEFKQRLCRLIEALGQCWDSDPRVAWVQMGIIGFWGEHHNPHPDLEMQKLLGTAFEKAFQNKQVLVRHPNEFEDFEFGVYWDSWAHQEQTFRQMHGAGIDRLNVTKGRWMTHPIEGEAAYNWGSYKVQPGDDPNDTLSDQEHRAFFIDTIRNLHCSALGWIANYDQDKPEVQAGAEEVQKAFGYRFVLEEFSFSPVVRNLGDMRIKLRVRNTGSAPFYQDWPLRLNLLDPLSRRLVWSQEIENVDIRTWLPGDGWDESVGRYRVPAKIYFVDTTVSLPGDFNLPAGEYVLALSIPDPDLEELGLRLAIQNYFEGDFHPLGIVAYGVNPTGRFTLLPELFADPMGE